jgi:GT2 family glycosyltransferase
MRDPKTGKVTYGGLSRSSWIRPLKFIKVEPGESEIEIDTMNGNFVYVPNEVTKLVGNLDPEFEHMWGDMDYGLRARAVGVRIWLMPGTIGFCSRNPASKIWCAPGIGIRERWSRMNGPRGIPWRNWGLFAKRHGGPFWFLYAFWAYRGLFFRTGKVFQTIPGTKLATKADAKISKD